MKLKSSKVRARGFSPADNLVALQVELNKPETRERAKLEMAFWQFVRELEPQIFADVEDAGKKATSILAINAARVPEFVAGISRDVRMFVETIRALPLEMELREEGALHWAFAGLQSMIEGQAAKTALQFLPAALPAAARTAAVASPPPRRAERAAPEPAAETAAMDVDPAPERQAEDPEPSEADSEADLLLEFLAEEEE
ncbi:MAG: hypothetical protein H6566_18625 [Lewinellaceae bacterium]|nr:hypothetical protein [Lewinellaceae bacterium]